jgi:hypothetical protein
MSAAPVSRAVTAAPGVQPVSSRALAKEPESPKIAEEKRATPSPDARKPEALAVTGATAEAGVAEVGAVSARLFDAGTDASRQE